MTERSFTYWAAMSDKTIAERIGQFVNYHRLQQNKTQDQLSREAGISRSTLSLLERGDTVSTSTLFQVLRTLGQLQVLELFSISETISPLAMAKAERYKRKRARNSSKKDDNEVNW